MTDDIKEIRGELVKLLQEHADVLRVAVDTDEKYEVYGTIPTLQGKKRVDGIYFASVIPKPKDVRLYFFPTYSHRDKILPLPPDLQKCLKGKSCFHIKKINDELRLELRALIARGVELYQKDGHLDKSQ